ncbi:AN1-type zinc finger protein 4 [Brachionichthys hirsutus]|uniref:AN1-type zinc finger protein 4 n=1 Tax=Brachionichthys hirsutus TaxID=412623 RepID=UPI0036043CF8
MTDRKEPPFFNDDSVGAFQYKLPFYDIIELFIETLTGTCFELRVLPFEAVVSVKAKIQRLEGIPVAQQHLIWNNTELDDEHCLHDYGIAGGCTLKLVLAMRGGPINTRRVTMEDPIKDVTDLMDGSKEEGWERILSNKQVTFVVYREGDQLNLFRVVDRGSGSLTPRPESLSAESMHNACTEEEEEEEDGASYAAARQSRENSITMNKMKLLKAKMEDMNLNKKPKKLAKLKPRPPISPHPFSSSLGSPSARHHQRAFRSLPHINPPRQSSARLPPIAGCKSPGAAASAQVAVHRRPPPFSSPSCYVLQEEEPWETCPPFASIRPPPKVSRLDMGGTRSTRDCVYPQLPPSCLRGAPGSTFDPAEPTAEAAGFGSLEEAAGLVVPAPPGAPFGELSEPLSLDVSRQPDVGVSLPRFSEVGAQHQSPLSPSPLSSWTLETGDAVTSRADRTLIGASFHIGAPPMPACASPSTSSLRAQSSARAKHGSTTPYPPTTSPAHPPHLCGIKVESPGKRPGLVSTREGVAKVANRVYEGPAGSPNNADLLTSRSTRAPDGFNAKDSPDGSLGLALALPPAIALEQGSFGTRLPSNSTNRLLQNDLIRQLSPVRRAAASYVPPNASPAGGVTASFGRGGAATRPLPPVKAPTGPKKKSFKHCFLCGRKTGLAASYECRCGHNFCAAHRYAETHACTYDYKSSGRRFLQETSPLVSAPKLPKI